MLSYIMMTMHCFLRCASRLAVKHQIVQPLCISAQPQTLL
jgi:hypothetical protein